MPVYGYDEDGGREHEDCDWCGAGSCADGRKCGLKPVEDYPGDDYDPLAAPPLSPEERAVVERFEAEADPLVADVLHLDAHAFGRCTAPDLDVCGYYFEALDILNVLRAAGYEVTHARDGAS